MNYNLTELIKDIRIAIDRNKTSEQLASVEDIDTLSLEEIIQSKIVDSVRMVEIDAPLRLIGSGTAFPDANKVITWDSQAGYGGGYVQAPDDFLRLVSFKMSDWEKTVFVPIYGTDPAYLAQRSRFAGIRGNTQKPVVAITNAPEGLRIEFYSCENANATVAQASYIKVPEITGEGENQTINICPLLRSAVVYHCASMVANVLGEDALANKLAEQVINLMK